MDRYRDHENGHVGEQLALEGIAAATIASPQEQIAAVDVAILSLASEYMFTSDDVWIRLGHMNIKLDHPNVIGGRFRYWIKKRKIRRTEHTARSERPNRHGATLFFYEGFNRG